MPNKLIYALDEQNNCRWVMEKHLHLNGGSYFAIPWLDERTNELGRLEKEIDSPDIAPLQYLMPDEQRHVTFMGMTDQYRKHERRNSPVAERLECGHNSYGLDELGNVEHSGIFELQDCSPQATAKIKTFVSGLTIKDKLKSNEIYPFEIMQIGQCFIVKFESRMAKNIRVRVSKKNKITLKQFIVIKHNEFQCYEVARVK